MTRVQRVGSIGTIESWPLAPSRVSFLREVARWWTLVSFIGWCRCCLKVMLISSYCGVLGLSCGLKQLSLGLNRAGLGCVGFVMWVTLIMFGLV